MSSDADTRKRVIAASTGIHDRPAISDTEDLKTSVPVSNPRRETETLVYKFESPRIVLERVLPKPYTLSYACLTIPRFSQHRLVGDLTEFLHHHMKNIAIAYGWKMEFLDVRPGYLQWVLVVGAATSPATFMRVTLQQTSRQIFKEFPRFRRENTSGNFWVPGYMVLAGMEPYPPEMVKEFIRLARKQQGLPVE